MDRRPVSQDRKEKTQLFRTDFRKQSEFLAQRINSLHKSICRVDAYDDYDHFKQGAALDEGNTVIGLTNLLNSDEVCPLGTPDLHIVKKLALMTVDMETFETIKGLEMKSIKGTEIRSMCPPELVTVLPDERCTDRFVLVVVSDNGLNTSESGINGFIDYGHLPTWLLSRTDADYTIGGIFHLELTTKDLDGSSDLFEINEIVYKSVQGNRSKVDQISNSAVICGCIYVHFDLLR